VIALLLTAPPRGRRYDRHRLGNRARTRARHPRRHRRLISDTRARRRRRRHNETGTYVFPNVRPTYTIEVSLQAFKTVKAPGIIVTGGDRVGVQPIYQSTGRHQRDRHRHRGITARADRQSAERSYAVSRRDRTCRWRAPISPRLPPSRRASPNGCAAGARGEGGAGTNNI